MLQLWNDDIIEALRELRAQGFSYSDAARRINATFGTCFTREATIGKARRLRLASDSTAPSKPGSLHVPQGIPAAIPRRDQQSERSPSAWSESASCNPARLKLGWSTPLLAEPAADLMPLRCADITPRRIAFADLEPEHCRYPYGEGPYRFCGHVRRPGSAYCPAHADLVAGPEAMPPLEFVIDRITERHHHTVHAEDPGCNCVPDLDFRPVTENHVSTDCQGGTLCRVRNAKSLMT